jgi:hypothetical protein
MATHLSTGNNILHKHPTTTITTLPTTIIIKHHQEQEPHKLTKHPESAHSIAPTEVHIENIAINITQTRLHPRQQENTHWGDILTEKSHNLTRIYSQNVNGIQLEDDGGQFKEICTIHQEVQADITCIQEHNLDTTQYKVTKIIRETAQKHCQRARTNIASSPVHFSGTWKPGGTAIMSTGSITGRITATGTDNWGRWSYQTFQGHNRLLVVTFITVYQVVEKFAPDKGQFTAGSPTMKSAATARRRNNRPSTSLPTRPPSIPHSTSTTQTRNPTSRRLQRKIGRQTTRNSTHCRDI